MVLTKNGYRARLVDRNISLTLETMGAVCIEGPKWCGKTWTGLNLSERFRSSSRRPPSFLCVLVGMSSYAYQREDGVYVVPITALGP